MLFSCEPVRSQLENMESSYPNVLLFVFPASNIPSSDPHAKSWHQQGSFPPSSTQNPFNQPPSKWFCFSVCESIVSVFSILLWVRPCYFHLDLLHQVPNRSSTSFLLLPKCIPYPATHRQRIAFTTPVLLIILQERSISLAVHMQGSSPYVCFQYNLSWLPTSYFR